MALGQIRKHRHNINITKHISKQNKKTEPHKHKEPDKHKLKVENTTSWTHRNESCLPNESTLQIDHRKFNLKQLSTLRQKNKKTLNRQMTDVKTAVHWVTVGSQQPWLAMKAISLTAWFL